MDGSPIGLSSPFRLRLELLGIALEKKGPDILETRTQGKCTGAMLRIVWRLMSSRSPRLGRSFQQMPGEGSDPQSRGQLSRAKARPQPTGSIPVPCLPCPWADTTSMAPGCSAGQSRKKYPVFPEKQMWL